MEIRYTLVLALLCFHNSVFAAEGFTEEELLSIGQLYAENTSIRLIIE